MITAIIISYADLVHAIFYISYPYYANMMRVVVLLSFSNQLRYSCLSLLSDLWDSSTILITIFIYTLVFSLTVHHFYRPVFQGITYLRTNTDTYRNMLEMYTYSNFPDIFLPSMNSNYFNAWLFMSFLIGGHYFLVNLLTANVFNNYNRRLETRRSSRKIKRLKYIEVIYKRHDLDKSGTLNHLEAKEFLADVFDYNYRWKSHRNMAGEILRIVDVDNKQ